MRSSVIPSETAKIGADTAEKERTSAENLPKIGNYPSGPLPYGSTMPMDGLSCGTPRHAAGAAAFIAAAMDEWAISISERSSGGSKAGEELYDFKPGDGSSILRFDEDVRPSFTICKK